MDTITETAGTVAGALVPVQPRNVGDTVRASWNFSLDQVRSAIARFRPESKDALVAAFRWCIDPAHPMRREEFARRIGCSDNLLYRIYTGRYYRPGTREQQEPSDELVHAVEHFLDLERKRYHGGRMDFVVTPTAKRVFMACDLALESQSPVFLSGPSHIGKTMALEYYQQANNHSRTFYARMVAASGLGGMVRRIALRCGISERSNTAGLIERIKRSLTPNTLLILDEVHLLSYTYRIGSFFACVEVIREIYDETKCGMVLCGTRLLMEKVEGAKHAELEQVWNRGVHKIRLPDMPTKRDIESILKHGGLEFPERGMEVTVKGTRDKPYEILRYLAKSEKLKAICERIRYGQKLASKAGEVLGWKHFVTAHLLIEKENQPDPEWE